MPIGRYIEMFRLPGSMLHAPELYIDETRFRRLAGSVALREGFLDWGFRAGEKLDFSVFGEFGTSLLRQPSLKVALDFFVETASAESLQTQFMLTRHGGTYWFILTGYRGAPAGRSIVELYDVQLMSNLVRDAAGNEWLPSAVHLQCNSLPESIGIKEVSKGDIRFSSTMTAIAIPESLMAMPMSQYCSSAHSEYEPDQANFTRAFQRWAGLSPRQHRSLNCQPHS